MPDESPSNSRLKFGWLVGIALAFLIFAAIAGYSSRMTADYPDYDKNREQERAATLEKTRHDENALLAPVDDKGQPTATWADQAKGTIKISIEEAMAHEVAAMRTEPAQTGCEIPEAASAVAPPAAGKAAMPAPANPATPPAPAAAAAGSAKPSAPPAKTTPDAKKKPAASAIPAAKTPATNSPPSAPDEMKKQASPAASASAPNATTPPQSN